MKTRATALAACMVLLLCMNSCTKSDLPEPSSGHYLVRLYDDTLPDPRSNSIHIAAADGRLLMTYGHTFEQLVLVYGNLTFPPPSENVYLLTDNEGNLLRKGMLPSGLTVSDVVSLADNSFLTVLNTGIPNLFGGPEWNLHIMRIDPNGVMGPVVQLNAPTIHPPPFQQIYDLHLWPAPDGNALISFYYSGADGGYGIFVGQMDMQGSFLWHREFENRGVTGCVGTPDGGYMISGRWWNPDQTTGIYIMKTNSTFDSTWSRFMVPEHGMDSRIQVASAGNGNYWLNYLNSYDGNVVSHLLEFNAGGETVDSNSYMPDIGPYNISSVMLQYGASGLFMLHANSMNSFNSSISDRFNSSYAILDANLNITKQSLFQDQTSDMLNSGCRTSDGRIACFGITQSYHRWYYKPELIIIN